MANDRRGGVVAAGFDAKKGQRCHVSCPLGRGRGNTLAMTPQSRAIPVLLTRPAAAGDRFAADLAQDHGERLRIISSPLIAPRFLHPDLPDGAAGLVLTSETGVTATQRLQDRGAALPKRAFCVGDRTAAAARQAGFDAVSAGGDADALVAMILSLRITGPLLHLHGRDTRGDVAPRLTAGGVPTSGHVVYEQLPQPLSMDARAVLDTDGVVIVPLFSPRTASLFAATVPHRATLWVAAMSPAVADAVAGLPVARIVTAARPDATAIRAAIAALVAGGGA